MHLKMETELNNPLSATPSALADTTSQDGTRQGETPPPDGGYGWACVAACFTVNCFTWGTVSVSLLFPYLPSSNYPNDYTSYPHLEVFLPPITPFNLAETYISSRPTASTSRTTYPPPSSRPPHPGTMPSSAASTSPSPCSSHPLLLSSPDD